MGLFGLWRQLFDGYDKPLRTTNKKVVLPAAFSLGVILTLRDTELRLTNNGPICQPKVQVVAVFWSCFVWISPKHGHCFQEFRLAQKNRLDQLVAEIFSVPMDGKLGFNVSWVIFYGFYHGKSPWTTNNHHFGEYIWNLFFQPPVANLSEVPASL